LIIINLSLIIRKYSIFRGLEILNIRVYTTFKFTLINN